MGIEKEKKILLRDDQERSFGQELDMYDFFRLQKERDVLTNADIWGLKLGSIMNAPILVNDIKEELNLQHVSDDTVVDTMERTQLVLSYPLEADHTVMPVRETAFTSLCNRAGLEGRAIRFAYANYKDSVIAILNEGFSLWEKPSKVLVRDEKVSAVHSDEYAVLPTIDLLEILKEELDVEFEGWKIKEATTSHSTTIVYYDLSSKKKELLSPINRALKRAGHEGISGNPYLVFTTSDTAISGANLYPYIILDNGVEMRLGESLTLRHDGKEGLEKFRKNVESVFSLFMDSTKRLEELSKQLINYPSDCFVAIAQKLSLPKSITMRVVADLDMEWPAKTTALDVYMALWRIPAESEAKTKEAEIINQEKVARALRLNFHNYDEIYKWI